MMTDQEKYLFDLNGYLVVEDVLTPEQVHAMNEAIDHNREYIRIRNHDSLSGAADRHGGKASDALAGEHGRGDMKGFLNWPKPWCEPFRDLLIHPGILRYMVDFLGDDFRYSNANGITMTAGNEGHVFHGGGAPMRHHSFYRFQDGRMWNGLTAVCYQLADVNPGDGGFACLPGSHKSNYSCPREIRRLEAAMDNVRHIPVRAGSAIIFTEALMHGALPWKASHERRTLLYRYIPACMAYGRKYEPDEYESFADELSPLHRALIEPPYYSGRQSIAELLEAEDEPEPSETQVNHG
ncbi:MAG: phytanoyl-CoA dioxygenase family protein [Gemmatimonadetes bacterium]|nr:phytanoyl-CoA dioxygenase family protein [Gemmatimonadota bacterium]MYF72780.1 phytanoyl-CoA dioxygenase family protein [Gemmatimonadota bacterium]MYK54238.1 phytanoyl-CoA dioxygenase family protein [Gemmatimonadota bacterium]